MVFFIQGEKVEGRWSSCVKGMGGSGEVIRASAPYTSGGG